MRLARARRLLLLACLGCGACVVPLAPQFDDPEENYPPYIVDSRPPVGWVVSGMADFSVTLADQNAGDHLFIRWLHDYPPLQDPGSRRFMDYELPPQANGGVVRDPPISVRAHCDNFEHTMTQHRVMLAVSDRPWVKDDEAPKDSRWTTVPKDARLLRAVWFLNLECPQQ